MKEGAADKQIDLLAEEVEERRDFISLCFPLFSRNWPEHVSFLLALGRGFVLLLSLRHSFSDRLLLLLLLRRHAGHQLQRLLDGVVAAGQVEVVVVLVQVPQPGAVLGEILLEVRQVQHVALVRDRLHVVLVVVRRLEETALKKSMEREAGGEFNAAWNAKYFSVTGTTSRSLHLPCTSSSW